MISIQLKELKDHLTKGVSSRRYIAAMQLAMWEKLNIPKDPDFVIWLLPLLKEESSALRFAAVTALGKLGFPGAIPELEIMLSDPDELVAKTAQQALEKLRNKT